MRQIDLPLSDRGLEKIMRIGPSNRRLDDPSYVEQTHTFFGVGLRPYAPVHLAAEENGVEIKVSWVRRTRIDGDNWQGFEVPIGETSEQYLLRIKKAGAILREQIINQPNWVYGNADQSADGAVAPFDIEVAQVSDAWGPGFNARMTWNG